MLYSNASWLRLSLSLSSLALDFLRRHAHNKLVWSMSTNETRERFHGPIRQLTYALAVNTSLLFVRAIYRAAELADGIEGTIIHTQWPFVLFDGTMVVLAMFTYNAFHVGRPMDSEQEFNDKLKSTASRDWDSDFMPMSDRNEGAVV
ncbi:hypothetical protein D9758_016252 [Tetrapyrgos nigripes]|uniref:Uncharacterized protein n=1 Tax=Tetrapyrgos nigripes TaxID=182062 RepID=A0A8H5C0U2_9AGAR|nr:hypothetical protein D9758_016252 [Tetrapyrgos nigripes]